MVKRIYEGCSICGEEVDSCDRCYKSFDNKEFLCTSDIGIDDIEGYHFCSKKCINDFIWHDVLAEPEIAKIKDFEEEE